MRITFNENSLTHSRSLLRSLNDLNIYQINLCQHANFMCKFQKNQAPKLLNVVFEKPNRIQFMRENQESGMNL